MLHGGEISERAGHPVRDEGGHREQAIGPDVIGGAFLGDAYTKLARGLRLPVLVPCLGVRCSSETPLAVQAAMNLRPGQSL